MILAFDTYYFKNKAKTVCLAFKEWTSSDAFVIYSEILEDIEEYIPGEFYKRELPCILSLLKQIKYETIEAIIVDGFVYLDDANKLGLGGHLYQALNSSIPVIGVAKTNFLTIEKNKRPLMRGESKNPLFVTAIGIDLDTAAAHIASMAGNYRIPKLLKELDTQTRSEIETD